MRRVQPSTVRLRRRARVNVRFCHLFPQSPYVASAFGWSVLRGAAFRVVYLTSVARVADHVGMFHMHMPSD